MDTLKIKESQTFFEIPATPYSQLGQIVRTFTRSNLVDYDFNYRIKRMEKRNSYSWYDEQNKVLRMPIGFLNYFKQYMEGFNVPMETYQYPRLIPKEIEITPNPNFPPRNDAQKEALEYLTDFSDGMARKGLSLSTGIGKTYVAIKTIAARQQVGMIVVSGLVDQWAESIDKFTDAREDTYIIKGFKSIDRLLKSDYQPKIILCSLETLRPYVYKKGAYEHLLDYEDFLRKYGVGVKVMDEVHLNFSATVQMDLRSIVPYNLYLTATFNTTRKDTRKIFSIVYPDDIKHGGGHKPYVNVTFYKYASNVMDRKCKVQRGYQHIRFEKELFTRITKMGKFCKETLFAIINAHYINKRDKGEKCLIFFSTVQMIDAVKVWLEQLYPNENIKRYTAADPEEHLGDGVDIILSTHKSCGVGTDISMLRTCINTVSISSPVLTEQILGRLRELSSGNTPEYVDIYDPSISSHCRHYVDRSFVYKTKALNYYEYTL